MIKYSGVCAIVPRHQEGYTPKVIGMGILVDEREIVTCAHVVDAAIGDDWFAEPGEGIVRVCFPFIQGSICLEGTVDRKRYFPPNHAEEGKVTDIAVVRLNHPAPSSVGRANFRVHEDDAYVKIFGFRRMDLETGDWESHPDGEIVESKVLGPLPGGRAYFEGIRSTGAGVEPGFSGAGVFDPRQGAIVGMVVKASADVKKSSAQFIDARTLLNAYGRAIVNLGPPSQRETGGHNLRYIISSKFNELDIVTPDNRSLCLSTPWRDSEQLAIRIKIFRDLAGQPLSAIEVGEQLSAHAKAIGRALYELLFDEQCEELLRQALSEQTPPVLMLISSDDAVLALPWELLHDGFNFIVGEGRLDILRSTTEERSSSLLGPPTGAFKLLINISAPDGQELNYEEESYRISRALADRCEMRLCELGTLDDLVTTTANFCPKGIHFSGHGSPGSLLFETDVNDADEVAIDRVVQRLRGESPGGLPSFFLSVVLPRQHPPFCLKAVVLKPPPLGYTAKVP